MHFWKKNNDNRNSETLYDLVEETKVGEKGNNFKRYKDPVIVAAETNSLIRDIKRQTVDVRNNIQEK